MVLRNQRPSTAPAAPVDAHADRNGAHGATFYRPRATGEGERQPLASDVVKGAASRDITIAERRKGRAP